MTQTIATALHWARTALVLQTGADIDARTILAHILQIDRGLLALKQDDPVDAGPWAQFQAMIVQRQKHQPVSQIIGQREFWGRTFKVTPDVLDPRADTETLIAEALKLPRPKTILDLGLGTGCILLTLLSEIPSSTGVGVDLSTAALDVAAVNVKALGLGERAQLITSNWFEDVEGTFDLIVSNPPYITTKSYATLAPDVRDWEPKLALCPNADGLDAYRAIAQGCGAHLAPNGHVAVEIGFDQYQAVTDIFTQAGFAQSAFARDLGQNDRVIVFKRQK